MTAPTDAERRRAVRQPLSQHELVCSNARLLANEIQSDAMASTGEIVNAIATGFAIHEALARDAALEEAACIAEQWDHRGDIAKAIRAVKASSETES